MTEEVEFLPVEVDQIELLELKTPELLLPIEEESKEESKKDPVVTFRPNQLKEPSPFVQLGQ